MEHELLITGFTKEVVKGSCLHNASTYFEFALILQLTHFRGRHSVLNRNDSGGRLAVGTDGRHL